MREIFVNGVSFRYRTERDLGLILRHAHQPARLRPVCELTAAVKRRRNLVNHFRRFDGRASSQKTIG